MGFWNLESTKPYFCCVCKKMHCAKTERIKINKHCHFLEGIEGVIVSEIGHFEYICFTQYDRLKEKEFQKQQQEKARNNKTWHGKPLQLELWI